MNNEFILESEIAFELSCGDTVEGYRFVTQYIVDEWRWGNIHELIFEHPEGKFWGFTYKEQTGDHYWSSIDPSETSSVTCYAVTPVEVTTVKYIKA